MTSPARAAHRAKVASGVFLAVVALYLVFMGVRQGASFMVWSEETMVHPSPGRPVLLQHLGSDGAALAAPTCDVANPPRTVWFPERPRWSLCAGGTTWPLMIAPYFTGVFYWPSALLSPLHHGDVIALRRIGLVLAVASLAFSAALAARLAGRAAASAVALALATNPCFVLLHASLVHFETLPWLLLVAASLVLLGREPEPEAEAPRPGPRQALAASALLGLALLANFKTVFLAAPFALVGWRLGRGRAPRFTAPLVLSSAAIVLALLAPMIALQFFSPPDVFGDRSGMWARSLLAHLTSARAYGNASFDMLRWWSNMADYLSAVNGPAPFNRVAFAIAAGSALFVVIDGARTLWRAKGCALTALAGACVASYVLTVALLYDTYPANFAPLHSVYGLSLGAAMYRLGRWLGGRIGAAGTLAPWLLALPFAWSAEQTIHATATSRAYLNVATEQRLVAWLDAHPSPGAALVTADPMFAGVVDSLSHGRQRTVDASALFVACQSRDGGEGCVGARTRALLRWAGARPLRLLIAEGSGSAVFDGHGLDDQRVAAAARAAGFEARVEARFATPSGAPGLMVLRLASSGAR